MLAVDDGARKKLGLNPDWLTRSIFLSRIKKHLRHLRAAPDAPVGLVEYLSKQTAEMPGIWLAAVEGFNGWPNNGDCVPAVRAGCRVIKPRHRPPHQLRLIRELGFEVV